jgi:rhamnulokinase
MSRVSAYAAVDLGAGSGRVILGLWDGNILRTKEMARFATPYMDDGEVLRWNVRQAFESTLTGLRAVQEFCSRDGAVFAGIGVDSWGVDYGLVRAGVLDLDDVRHHRRPGSPGRPFRSTPSERYAITGVLDQSINTSVQLLARLDDGTLDSEAALLFIPDLWVYLLSGVMGTDSSIASTSQLLDVYSGQWASELTADFSARGLEFPSLFEPGTIAGHTTAEVSRAIGAARPVPVVRVAGHDTASALSFAAPASAGSTTSGLVSSGTWSLAGVALADPIASERARELDFTTERNLRGHLMVRNLSGMWLIQESLRVWSSAGLELDIRALSAEAGSIEGDENVIDVGDPRLLEPGDMPARIAELAVESGRTRPTTPAELVRVIVDSLAAAYASGIDDAAGLADVHIRDIRIVGGGSRNELLCQLTADRSGRPVLAGPAEATALGNLAVQLWASGACSTVESAFSSIDHRELVQREYQPQKSE